MLKAHQSLHLFHKQLEHYTFLVIQFVLFRTYLEGKTGKTDLSSRVAGRRKLFGSDLSMCTRPALGRALLFGFSQLQRCSTSISGPQASLKGAAKTVIDFGRVDRNLSDS